MVHWTHYYPHTPHAGEMCNGCLRRATDDESGYTWGSMQDSTHGEATFCSTNCQSTIKRLWYAHEGWENSRKKWQIGFKNGKITYGGEVVGTYEFVKKSDETHGKWMVQIGDWVPFYKKKSDMIAGVKVYVPLHCRRQEIESQRREIIHELIKLVDFTEKRFINAYDTVAICDEVKKTIAKFGGALV